VGAEAGIVTTKQLVNRVAASGQRLFREGALANILYISDTHDPGDDYYGKPGAPYAIPTYDKLRSAIETANPGLNGLKFNGIVPLPPANDSRLNGVSTLGRLPASLQESQVGEENLNGFSYLPFIAKSKGVAMHTVGNSWANIFKELTEEFSVREIPLIYLSFPTSQVVEVRVEGVSLHTSKYRLRADLRTLELTDPNPSWPDLIKVEIEYSKK
jgi:hypothetical protein